MRCNDAKHQGPCNWHARLHLRRECSEWFLLGYVDFSWLQAFFLHLLCAVQWMTACLFVPGLKEAESILMGSEHLCCKVTPTGLACADPATQKVRLLTETQGWFPTGFQVHCHPVSAVILITIAGTELPGCPSFSLLLLQEVGHKSFFLGIDDSNLSFWGFHSGLSSGSWGWEALLMLPCQQIASGLAMLQCFFVKYHIDFGAFLLTCGPGP